MNFIRVAVKSEVAENSMIAVTVNGKEILLANIAGAFYAIANKCTHVGGPLAKGTLDGFVVTCPKHGARFDVRTGEAVGEAKIGFIKLKVKDELSFPVKVEGEDILVGIG
jgi:3-phenylpropionate/trans-cinnamate dioxygenase ferredoxin subunit